MTEKGMSKTEKKGRISMDKECIHGNVLLNSDGQVLADEAEIEAILSQVTGGGATEIVAASTGLGVVGGLVVSPFVGYKKQIDPMKTAVGGIAGGAAAGATVGGVIVAGQKISKLVKR
jgi:hypothetical protein